MARKDDVWQNRTGSYIEMINPAGYDILVNGSNRYINFNLISGSTGYGIRDNAGTIQVKNSGGSWSDIASGGSGLLSLNGLTGSTQTFAVGTSGTDFAISSSGTTHTFNLPAVGVGVRGVMNNGAQTIGGVKTWTSIPVLPATNPTTANQAVRKGYVDAFAQGVLYKTACRVASQSNITISTALNNGDTLDGVVLATNDRVLVKNQTSPAENGIYVVSASPARATDADSASEVTAGSVVFVAEGTSAGLLYVQTEIVNTLNTDPLLYTQISSAFTGVSTDGVYISGDGSIGDPVTSLGLLSTGNITGTGLTGDEFDITGIIGIANGGTNQSSYTTDSVIYFDGTSLVGDLNVTYTDSNKQFNVGSNDSWGTTPTHSIWLNDGIFAFQGINTSGGGNTVFLAIGNGAIASDLATIDARLSGNVADVLAIGIGQNITNIGSDYKLAIGNNVVSSGNGDFIIGNYSQTLGDGGQNFIVGNSNFVINNSVSASYGNTVFGGYAQQIYNGNYNVMGGYGNYVGGPVDYTNANIIFGTFIVVAEGVENSVVLGYDVQTSRSNAFVTNAIEDVYLGYNGDIGQEDEVLANSITYHTTDGFGTNIATPDMIWQTGIATGNAVGGEFIWKTSDAGASGTSAQSVSNKMQLGVDGQLRLNNYGAGSITGTPTKNITVDADGYIIETDLSEGYRYATYVVDAAGNGDYTDLQSAITALGTTGGRIFVRAGTYTVGAAGIRFTSASGTAKITIEGEGDATKFNFNTSTLTTCFAMGDTTQRSKIRIKNIKISQQGTGATGIGINFSYFAECIFENITIENCLKGFTGSGTGTLYNKFYNCYTSCGGAGAIGYECGSVANENTFFSCRSLAPASMYGGTNNNIGIVTGFSIGAHSNKLIDCVAEGNTSSGARHLVGIDILASGHDTTVVGCYLELNLTNIQIANGVEGVTFNGGFSSDADTANISDLGAKGILFDNMTVQYEPYSKQRETNEYIILNNTTLGQYECFNRSTGFQKTSSSLNTVWTSLMTEISTNPAIITFGAGTFTTTTGLSIANSNIKIKGQGMGVTKIIADSGTGTDSTAFFKCDPTQSATAYSLTSDATAGDLTLTMSSANLTASGITAGDYIILYSSLSIDSEFSSRNQGELHRVVSVNTGTGVITIGTTNNGTHVYQTMTTTNSVKVQKLTMYQNVTIEGISFTDAATSRPNTYATGGVLMRFIDNLLIRDCSFYSMYNAGLQPQQCMNVKVSGCFFRDMKDVTPSANVFYGIVVRGACINVSIDNCNFENMRHGVTQGAGTTTSYAGTTRNMSVSNCTSLSTYTSHFDVHQGAEGISFINNTMIGDDGSANGIQARSPATIVGNSIVGVLGRGISLFGNAHGSTVSGNDIKGCTVGVAVDNGVNKVNITGNTIRSGSGIGVSLIRFNTTNTASFTNASPTVVTVNSHGFTAGAQVDFTAGGGSLPTGVSAGTNYYVLATDLSTNTFKISTTEGGTPVNTSSTGSGATCYYRSGNDSQITDNQIYDNVAQGIYANGAQNVKVSGNVFRNNSLPIQIANTDSLATGWMITDNMSRAHTSSDSPTITGTSHTIRYNKGFGDNINFTVGFACAALTTVVDATTYYFGFPYDTTLGTTTAALRQKKIPIDCVLRGGSISIVCTAGTSETFSIYARINNTTDVLLTSSAVSDASSQQFSVTGLSTSISAGDLIEIKVVTPTWVTNPSSMRISTDLYFE